MYMMLQKCSLWDVTNIFFLESTKAQKLISNK